MKASRYQGFLFTTIVHAKRLAKLIQKARKFPLFSLLIPLTPMNTHVIPLYPVMDMLLGFPRSRQRQIQNRDREQQSSAKQWPSGETTERRSHGRS